MRRLTEFLHEVLIDLGTWCHTSTTQDFKTVLRRSEHEGLSFLTIVLPKFGRDFEKSLDQGFVAPSAFCGFHRSRGLPQFLGGFLENVFDRESGLLLDDPSIEAIWAIRQFTLMWAKMKLPCTDARIAAAFDKYIESERTVREHDALLSEDQAESFARIGRLLWADVFAGVDFDIYHGELVPKHGPGATADKLRGNAKWRQQEWTQRLEQVFPHWEYLVSSWSQLDRLTDVRILEPGNERPVRVIPVPKTLSTPRLIAIEPTCMQYMQQALLGAVRKRLYRDDFLRGLVGWSSQMPNQRLAHQGSRNGALATLDLSEASDRVSNQHVRILLRNHPNLAAGVDSTRSRKADVPGHGVIRLAKFASMGSALCFPFEAMVFATIIFVGIEASLKTRLSREDLKAFAGQVRVYGDDIVIPVEHVSGVISALTSFGMKVNESKSFWTGKFRESCGKEYYDGEDVSIVRIRSMFPSSLEHGSEVVSTVSTRNQLYKAGLWNAARYLDDVLEELIPLPRVSEMSPVLGRHSFLGPDLDQRSCDELHRPLVKGGLVRVVKPASVLDDYGALLKCLTRFELANEGCDADEGGQEFDLSNLPVADVEHLIRAGRCRSLDIKIGWGPSA